MKALTVQYRKLPGMLIAMPYLDVRLQHDEQSVNVPALVDSGGMFSVLPYEVGRALGLRWDTQTIPLRLTGVLQGAEAYLITVKGFVSPFPPVDLVFAWVKQPVSRIRVILGQANFFKKYHVSLNGLQETFEVMPHKIDEYGGDS